ncbi:MAG TPA: M23 family metallopeptidase, partial [Polyangiaceae bacterium]|nr:M23 family metallopeptidase [Polyangiaceae bacterium]
MADSHVPEGPDPAEEVRDGAPSPDEGLAEEPLGVGEDGRRVKEDRQLPSEPVPTAAAPRVSTAPRGPSTASTTHSPRGEADTPRGLEVMRLDPPAEPVISPRMTAVFGGLFGLATVASIVALLIQIFPVRDQRGVAAQATDTSDTPAQSDEAPEKKGPKKRERKLLPSPWRVAELKDTHRIVRGTMKREAFVTRLQDDGVPKGEVYRILKAMEGVKNFDRTGRNDEYIVALERSSRKVAAFEYVVSPTEIYQAKTGDDGLLKGERLDMKVGHEEFATAFYIGPDFVKSYQRVGLEEGLTAEINAAFNGRTSTEAFEEGGVVRLIVVETTALGAFVRYDHIKAIEYRPPDPSKEPVRAYYFEGSGTKGYVDEKGRKPSARGWRSPCPGAPVTSHFNPKRMHPVLNRVMPHNGTDFGAPSGTPVYAAYRGEVTLVGPHGASGNLVLIDHPGGIQTGYAHLSRFAPGLKRGQKVGTRQLIGYVGSTGRSTGPHLHFSAKRDGKFFNALELKLDALTLLPIDDRGAFMAQKQLLDQALESIPLPEPPAPEPEPEAPEDDDVATEPEDPESGNEADEA